MARVQLYTTAWCGYCVRAKVLLDERGIPYEEIRIDEEPDFRAHLEDLTGGWTVPQVVIDGEPRGGYAELVVLDRAGELAGLAA
jgi:glutaredoxin 3